MADQMVSWPNGADLGEWIRSPISAGSVNQFDAIVQAATEVIVGYCDPALLPEDTALCPPSVRTAVLIEAARLNTRPDNTTGVISFGDFASSVQRLDPDVQRLLIRYRVSPSP